MKNNFKLNSNKKSFNYSQSLIRPGIGNEYKVRTFALTPDTERKINKLRSKYKLSRSAIIRILLENV